MKFKVKIRRDLAEVKSEAECIDGNFYDFSFGWTIEESDSSIYIGESAMIPIDLDYPKEAPSWIASGDLENLAFSLRTKLKLLKKGDCYVDTNWRILNGY